MHNRPFKIFKIAVMVALAILAFGFVTQHLWNWLMPTLFGLRSITFLQALGLLILSKVLLGGFHRHGGGGFRGRRDWKRKMEARWAAMTPEEREKFRTAMQQRWSCRPPHLRATRSSLMRRILSRTTSRHSPSCFGKASA